MACQSPFYRAPVITLLTDFGMTDHYVAAMKGVMLRICPRARLIDISHEITPYQVDEAGYVLSQAWREFPKGTVHLAVVDPGVGSQRRPIIASIDGHLFVAPDNGLLTLCVNDAKRSEFREITSKQLLPKAVSQTFHGRDVFAPVAALLAKGVPSFRFGGVIENAVRGDFAEPTWIGQGVWIGKILHIDRFGNAITNFRASGFAVFDGAFSLEAGDRKIARSIQHYGQCAPGELAFIYGSAGFWEIVSNQASAANLASLRAGQSIRLLIEVPVPL